MESPASQYLQVILPCICVRGAVVEAVGAAEDFVELGVVAVVRMVVHLAYRAKFQKGQAVTMVGAQVAVVADSAAVEAPS